MSDLTERLRNTYLPVMTGGILVEAADRIEELEAALREIRDLDLHETTTDIADAALVSDE